MRWWEESPTSRRRLLLPSLEPSFELAALRQSAGTRYPGAGRYIVSGDCLMEGSVVVLVVNLVSSVIIFIQLSGSWTVCVSLL